jgi:arginyl-tRNA synthetase
MEIISKIQEEVAAFLASNFQAQVSADQVLINQTKKEFVGDITVVVFPFLKLMKMAPPLAGEKIAQLLVSKFTDIDSYNIVKGFVNLSFKDQYWVQLFKELKENKKLGKFAPRNEKVLVEYSSPNTNKPLHLGHIRNILLGWTCANILEAVGYEVVRTQIVNDRGIAICKSMLAWKLFGEGKTPKSTGIKSDHFVGDFYVLFESKFKEEYRDWQATELANKLFEELAKDDQSKESFFKKFKNQYFNEYSVLGKQARQMLLDWEDNEESVRNLWNQMNNWVYNGFKETYDKLGVYFDLNYYESETYLLGKQFVEEGLSNNIFFKKDDGSIWIDLEDAGLDHKIVLRADGTSVYMTQDLGTAHLRYQKHGVDKMVYVVGNEQNYHFEALFEILKRLKEPYADGLFHLAYGMVDLPSGKMKSREGTVVDADDLIEEIISEAQLATEARGEWVGSNVKEQTEIARRIGISALKYFILKVHPKKRMVFDPKESLDLQGQTGPYIQNAFVRIKSIFRKIANDTNKDYALESLDPLEKELILNISQYPQFMQEAAEKYDPSIIAHYAYDLAKNFHRFYHHMRILHAETEDLKNFRLQLIEKVGIILEELMLLLGIEMPERM